MSRAQAQVLEEQLGADRENFLGESVKVVHYGPSGSGGPFLIGVDGDVSIAREILSERYARVVGDPLIVEAAEHAGPASRSTIRPLLRGCTRPQAQ